MNLGKSIKMALLHRDKRAIDLARDMGVSQSYVSGICSGKNNPSMVVVTNIARILGYPVSEFIALGEVPKPETDIKEGAA